MEELLRSFIEKQGPAILDWLVTDGVPILLLIVLLKFGLWLKGKIIKRLKLVHLKKLQKGPQDVDNGAEKRLDTLYGIIDQTIKVALYVIVLVTILTHIGIEVGPILASVGVVGLALGFGSQELVRDIVSGLFNLVENNIRVGDVVIINGVGGAVEKVELRTTVLRDYSGIVHVFQNGKINTLSNMTKDWAAAVFDIEVAYKEKVDRVMDVMKHVGDQIREDKDLGSAILDPIEVVGLDKLGESSMVIKARIRTKPGKQWDVSRRFKKDLKEAFDQEGIEIPYPHRVIVDNTK